MKFLIKYTFSNKSEYILSRKLSIQANIERPSGQTQLYESKVNDDDKKSESNQKRSSEKFMVVGSGEATCKSCGYCYKPENGDPNYPISIGTRFMDLPEDWACPTCGVNKVNFKAETKVFAGFAENQQFGFGTNSMTGEQKSLLIYGSLFFTFILFIGGYFLD
jgi:rubredoxin